MKQRLESPLAVLSGEHFELLFKTMQQGVVFQDAAGKVIAMNPAAEKILGKTKKDLLGRTSMDMERHTLRENGLLFPGIKHPSMEALQTGREVRDSVMAVYNPKEHEYRWIKINATPLFRPGQSRPFQVYTIFHDITARRQSEVALKANAEALKLAQRLARVGSWEWDLRTGRHNWTEEVYRIYGRNPAMPPAGYPEVKKYFTQESWRRLAPAVEKCLGRGTAYQCDVEVKRADSKPCWITARGEAIRDAAGKIIHLHGTVQDITERKQTEIMLQRANRTLRAIRASHEAMLHSTSETDLLKTVCLEIVQTGGKRMVWVGYAQKNRGKTIKPMAQAGFVGAYVVHARVTWADTPRGRGPLGTAVRTGRICLCRDTNTDPAFAPWRKEARKYGYGSLLALPLRVEKECIGALCIYAPEQDAFDAEEQQLFTDLANDLSLGITTLRLQAERKRLEGKILHSIEQEQERIGRDLHDGLCQQLVGAKFRSVYLRRIIGDHDPEAAQEADLLENSLNQAIAQSRDLARGLNPVKASPDGLELALQQLAGHVQIHRGAGTHCFCHFPQPVRVRDHKLSNHLFRIAQEAVQNAIKHAAAKNISITLTRQKRCIQLVIKDDGKGIPPRLKPAGMGVGNMRTRAALVGGTLEIRRRKSGGTAVTCTVKLPAPQGTDS